MQQALVDFEHMKYSACPTWKKEGRYIVSWVQLQPQLYPVYITEPVTLTHKATSKASQIFHLCGAKAIVGKEIL